MPIIFNREAIEKKRKEKFKHLDTGREISVVSTSYVLGTEEVEFYTSTIAGGYPHVIYEYLQNQLDAHDFSKGDPETWVYIDGQRKPLSLPEYLLLDANGKNELKNKVTKLEFHNKISEDHYYNPHHVVQTVHEASGTLGKHGRGSKDGGTSIVAGDYAESIEITTRDAQGNWHGETCMAKDPAFENEEKAKENYTFGFQRDEGEPRNETIVTIHNPNGQLMECLTELPNYFISTNPCYEGYRFNHITGKTVENAFTVFANKQNILRPANQGSLTNTEINQTGIKINQREKPRIEILSREIFKGSQDERYKDYVYVDGLKVDAGNKRFLFDWSFWGFGDLAKEYKVGRSAQSGYMDGDPNKLIAMALGRCTNKEVFKKMLNTSIIDGSAAVYSELSGINSDIITNISPAAQNTLIQAWEEVCQDRNIKPSEALVTSDSSAFKKAERMGVSNNTICLHDRVLSELLTKKNITKKMEDVVTIPPDPKDTGETQFFIDMNTSEEMIIDDLLLGMVASKAILSVGKDNTAITLAMALPDNFKDDIHRLVQQYEFRHIIRATDDLFHKFNKAINRRIIMNHSGSKVTRIDDPQDYRDGVYIQPKILREKSQNADEGVTLTISLNNSADRFRPFLQHFNERFKQCSKDGRTIDERLFDKDQAKHAKQRKKSLIEKTMLEEKELTKELKEKTRKMREQLDELDSKITDAKRWLGIAVEDQENSSPTRSTYRARDSKGSLPDGEIEKKYTTLFSCDATPQASNYRFGRAEKKQQGADESLPIKSTDQARLYVMEKLQALEKPDLQLLNAKKLPISVSDTLLCTVNGRFSGEINYSTKLAFSSNEDKEAPGIRINYQIESDMKSAPIFADTEIIGFYHPDKSVAEKISISYSPEYGIYKLDSSGEIPPGLEIYYKPSQQNRPVRKPNQTEKQALGDINILSPEWKSIVDRTNSYKPPITDKMKLDVAILAWTHAFDYNDNPKIDELFKGLSPEQRYSKIINESTGNCGYAAEGFITLCRFLDLPAVEVLGYLGNKGRFFPGSQNHAVASVYLGNEWVMVEPQLSYISDGYKIQQIPTELAHLIKVMPRGKNMFPRLERGNNPISIEVMAKKLFDLGIRLDEETISMLRRISEIEDDDIQGAQSRERDDFSIPRIPARVSDSGSNNQSSEESDIDPEELTQFVEDEPLGFIFEDAPDIDDVLSSNDKKNFIHRIGDKEGTRGFINLFREEVQRLGIEIGDDMTPTQVIKLMEKITLNEQVKLLSEQYNLRINPEEVKNSADLLIRVLEIRNLMTNQINRSVIEVAQEKALSEILREAERRGIWSEAWIVGSKTPAQLIDRLDKFMNNRALADLDEIENSTNIKGNKFIWDAAMSASIATLAYIASQELNFTAIAQSQLPENLQTTIPLIKTIVVALLGYSGPKILDTIQYANIKKKLVSRYYK